MTRRAGFDRDYDLVFCSLGLFVAVHDFDIDGIVRVCVDYTDFRGCQTTTDVTDCNFACIFHVSGFL